MKDFIHSILCRFCGHLWEILEIETCAYDNEVNDVVYFCSKCRSLRAEHIEKVLNSVGGTGK